MRPLLLAVLPMLLLSCENSSFDKDKRQIMAKDYLRAKLPHASKDFDVARFREDTVPIEGDTLFPRPLRYTLDFGYTDSAGVLQQKRGEVFFTPDGKSIIKSQLTNRAQ